MNDANSDRYKTLAIGYELKDWYILLRKMEDISGCFFCPAKVLTDEQDRQACQAHPRNRPGHVTTESLGHRAEFFHNNHTAIVSHTQAAAK